METALNNSIETAYSVQRISCVFIHAGHAVEQPFNRPQHRIHKGALAIKHARHEDAERLGDREHQQEENEI